MMLSVDAIMYKEPVVEFGELAVIPMGTVLESCYTAHNGYYFGFYNDLCGYVHCNAFEAYGDGLVSDDILNNTRTTLQLR